MIDDIIQRDSGELASVFRELLDGINDAFAIVDADWRVIYANRRARVLSAFGDDDLLGRTLWEARPQLLGTRFEAAYRHAMREQKPVHIEDYHERTDAWYDVYAFPSPNYLAIYSRDVTDRKRVETALRDVQELVDSRMRMVRGFSHDLKNPLGAADGHASLLADGILGALNEQQIRSIKRVRAALKDATNLIDDVVDIMRAEAGQLAVKLKPMDVAELVTRVADQWEGAAAAAGIGIEIGIEAEDALAYADPDRVVQILGNLLSNAIKYSQNRNRNRNRIRISVRVSDSASLVVDVIDTGIGIPEDKVPSLFKEFERIDPTVRPGKGLGLAISRRVARLMGGDLTVETRRGQGSKFSLRLPLHNSSMG